MELRKHSSGQGVGVGGVAVGAPPGSCPLEIIDLDILECLVPIYV